MEGNEFARSGRKVFAYSKLELDFQIEFAIGISIASLNLQVGVIFERPIIIVSSWP